MTEGEDVAIKTSYRNWGRRKALRFFSAIWGGKSQVVVYYFARKGIDGNGAMGFGIRAYISTKNARPLKDIETAYRLEPWYLTRVALPM